MLICVKCLVDLRCKKNGVAVARDPHHVQISDLYECPECGVQILTGAGDPLNWEQANDYYERRTGNYRRLYKTDTKEVREGELLEV